MAGEPYEQFVARMIHEKFDEWAKANPVGSSEPYYERSPDDIGLDDLEAAFIAGYNTPECW